MKITSNKNNSKKLTVILIIIMLFNIAFPRPSQASGMVTSLLSKPIATLVVKIFDAVNGGLATLVATDEKVATAVEGTEETIDDLKNSDDGLFTRVITALDSFETNFYNLLLSPEDIFSGKVQVTNANIFSSAFDENGMIDGSDWNLFNHLMKQLKQTTAGLYYSMRNIAAVVLLCLFVYCGIRIVLASANANEKAKWKEYLYDWLKALALLMTVHIIMIGIFYIVDAVTNGINNMMNNGDETIVTQIRKNFKDTSIFDVTGVWIYTIMYGYVTYMSIVFLIAYFKRLFFITVMIIIAPIVSVLYGLSKTTKATFNRWFKEFVMGIMIQPFHLIIYGVLIGIPMNVLSNSGVSITIGTNEVKAWQFTTIDAQLYALIAISMIRPVEKAMRKILGMGETILDNVASFESGKKTLDNSIKVGIEAVKTVGTVATIAATAGAVATAAPVAPGEAGQALQTMQNVGQTAQQTGEGMHEGVTGEGGVPPEEDQLDGDELKRNRFGRMYRGLHDKIGTGLDGLEGRFGSLEDNEKYKKFRKAFDSSDTPEGLRDTAKSSKAGQLLDAARTPEGMEQLEKLRSAMHGLTDSFYIGDIPKDWEFTGTLLTEHAQKKKEEMFVRFTSDEKNINKAIETYGLKDKEDKDGNIVSTAKEQALEKLKGMGPYVSMGITDVGKIAELQGMGMTPNQAVRTYAATTAKVNNFTTNQNNIQSMSNIVADRMGIPPERRADPAIVQQITQQVNQEFKEGAKYISSGEAKDTETLHRLVELERRIKEIGISGGTPKVDYVVKADKIIQKAVQDEMKKAGSFKGIKVPGSEQNRTVKKLETTLTEAAQEQIDRLKSEPTRKSHRKNPRPNK